MGMVLCWKGSKHKLDIVSNYYIILVIVYLLSVYFIFIRTGVLISIVLFTLIFGLRLKKRGSEILGLVTFFVFYSLISILGYTYNDIPLSAYWGDLSNQCFPIVFFFIAYADNEIKEKFYCNTTIAISIALIVGLYFYFANPQAYLDFMVRTSDSTYIGKVGTIQRFNSLFGSTNTGTLCVFLIILSIFKFYKNKFNTSQSSIQLFIYLLGFVCAQLTSQRSAMVMSVIVILAFYIIGCINKNGIDKKFNLFNIIVLLSIIYIFISLFQDYFDLIFERLASLENGYGDRNNQWKDNFNHHVNLLFGSGLGSVGHKAAGFVKYPIFDGAIFKYISELGIFGFIIFVLIIVRCTIYKIKYIGILWREYMIILVCILQSTASNTLSAQVVLPLFWFCIGIISSYKKNGNNSVLSPAVSSN